MLTAEQVIDQNFLETRCQLLEIAATLDRHDVAADRAEHRRPATDPRWERIQQALALLADRRATPDRAERLLRLFSAAND